MAAFRSFTEAADMTRSSFAPSRRPARLVASALAVLAMGAQAQQPAAPDIATLTASEAVRELCAGRLTSEQLVTAYVAQARAKANLNAFITLDEQGALAAARAADAARKPGAALAPEPHRHLPIPCAAFSRVESKRSQSEMNSHQDVLGWTWWMSCW